MTKTQMLIEEAKDTSLKVKQLVMKLLIEPMTEEQKEVILELYRLVK